MFERVRGGGRDPEAWLRGCAAAFLIATAGGVTLLGMIAMWGFTWLVRLLKLLIAWLLADPAWAPIDVPELAVVDDGVEVELGVEPLLYDPTDELVNLALAPPPPLPVEPAPVDELVVARLDALLGASDMPSLTALEFGGIEDAAPQMAVLGAFAEENVGVIGVIGLSDFEGDAIGGLIGATGTSLGGGGLGMRGVGGGTGEGLGGLGSGTLGTGRVGGLSAGSAAIVRRSPVEWGELQTDHPGAVCRAEVKVRDGEFQRVVDWEACPSPLRDVVERALRASAYRGEGSVWVTTRVPY